jgi:hypothetical protein
MLYNSSSYIHFNMSILIIQVKDEALIGNQKELPFQFFVDSDTLDKNLANNKVLVNIPMYYEVGAKVQGYCTPPTLELLHLGQRLQTSSEADNKSILKVGIDVSNPATTKVPKMEVQLRVPLAVRYSALRRRILSATGGTGSVESNSFVRLLELTSAHGNRSVGGLHYVCEKFSDPLDPAQVMQETPTTSKKQQNTVYVQFEAFGRLVHIVDRVVETPSRHSVDLTERLTCDPARPNADLLCAEFRCTVTHLFGAKGYGEYIKNHDRNATIEFQFKVFPRFYDIFLNFSKLHIQFHTSANVTKLPLGVDIGVEPFNSSWHSEQIFEMSAKLFEKPPDLIEIPLWIIILSILGGLLLLVLLFTILYFTGFFKRKKHDLVAAAKGDKGKNQKHKGKKAGSADDVEAEELVLIAGAGGGAIANEASDEPEKRPPAGAAGPGVPELHPLYAPSARYN